MSNYKNKNSLKIWVILIRLFIITICVNLNGELKEKTTISVYGLKSIGIPQSLAESLQEHLESNLLKYELFDVMSRSDIELILKEKGFQLSGASLDENHVIEAGHILGVEKIITGTISIVGSTYNLVLKLIDVKSAKIENSVSHKHVGNKDSLLDVIEVSLQNLLGDDKKTSSEKIKKLQMELAELKNKAADLRERWEIEKNKVVQYQGIQEKLDETQNNYHLSKNRELSLKQKLQETENAIQNKESTDLRLEDIEMPSPQINIDNLENKGNITESKKGKKIGIGALTLLTVIGVSVIAYQISGN